MDYIIDLSIAVCVMALALGIIVVTNFAAKFLIEKANASFDAARSNKVNAIVNLIETNITTAISNYISENNFANIDETELQSAAESISETVTRLTGSGVIDFVVGTFADNWDEWIVFKVQEAMVSRSQYEKKQ